MSINKEMESEVRGFLKTEEHESELNARFQAALDARYNIGEEAVSLQEQGAVLKADLGEKKLVGTDANDFFRSSVGYGKGKYRSRTKRVGNMTREDLRRKD